MNTEFSHRDSSSSLFVKTIIINILIFLLVIVKTNAEWIAIIGGLVIIAYIFLKAMSNPKEAMYLFLGIKFTFDSLWEIKIFELAGGSKIGLLELMILPAIFLIFVGNKMSRSLPKWPVGLSIVYLAWVLFAMLINEGLVDYSSFARQACLLFGLIIGLKYIGTIEDFQTVANLVFLSTVIPVFAAFLQCIPGGVFTGLPFLHFKMDLTRDIRISGLFYDSATMGMILIISLITNLYILQSGLVKRGLRILHVILIPVCIYIAIVGGTRSIIIISFAVVTLFLLPNLKRTILLLPLIFLAIYFSQPYMDKVFMKNTIEGINKAQVTEMLNETEYRTMFTGRVGIWQDIWGMHQSGTLGQQLLGTGLSSNAHSSYFFLLLQIGWLGLLFYLFYNFLIFIYLLRLNVPTYFFLTALCFLFSNLLMGISASTVIYTSFQIAVFFIMGACISIGTSISKEDTLIKVDNSAIEIGINT
jgi:hypothetical protein